MHTRSPVLERLLEGLEEAIAVGAPPAGRAAQAATKIFGALQTPGQQAAKPPAPSVVERHLRPAIRVARAAGGPIAKVADALAELEPSLTWYQRRGADANPAFAAAHSNATIVGQNGIESRGDVWVGVSLMAPDTCYPDHQHPPEEVYVVLSPGEWRQAERPWFQPGIGGVVYNPPNIVHAMRSGSVPLLAAWCLWLGN